ncbi:MAG: hypothetical protein RJB60_34 [Pseudomonadota bacterium]|jgi:hypothetical protein
MLERAHGAGAAEVDEHGLIKEIQRQQALVQAILAASTPADSAGLRAHRGHVRVLSGQLLNDAYPCVAAMVGPETLAQLGWSLWRQSPPTSGDLGEWGHALPSLLAALVAQEPEWQAWGCLPDLARLEWARHQCERAPDSEPELSSLSLLENAPPECLWLELRPGLQCIASNWPVLSLWQALQSEREVESSDLQACLSQLQPEAAVICRGAPHAGGSPWQAHMQALAPEHLGWMRQLTQDAPTNLAQMLDTCEPGFDFTAWLTQALQQGWFWRLRSRAAES